MILRKGAIAAHKGERILISINMRDGSVLAVGRGNSDWNYSAPHGAGRIMSRRKAKEKLALKDYVKAMEGVYTTSVNIDTLDEAPMAYKSIEGIIDIIREVKTVWLLAKWLPFCNASTLLPSDIVYKYYQNSSRWRWSFAEHLKGEFFNKFITFSSRPELIDMSNATCLRDKLEICDAHDDCSNTDLKAVFDLILNTAIDNDLKQKDLPNNILIISDMEFDSMTGEGVFKKICTKS